MNEIWFGKGCHLEKKRTMNDRNGSFSELKKTFSKNKQKNIKKNDLELYQYYWKNNSLLINEWFSKTIAFNWFNNFPDNKHFFFKFKEQFSNERLHWTNEIKFHPWQLTIKRIPINMTVIIRHKFPFFSLIAS